jgi:hypothetical protein
MSRSKFTSEVSIPHQRGRKQNMKMKRLTHKRVRKFLKDYEFLRKLYKDEQLLDNDPLVVEEYKLKKNKNGKNYKWI